MILLMSVRNSMNKAEIKFHFSRRFLQAFLIGVFCFSTAMAAESDKQCPDPNVKYNIWTAERYWVKFLSNNITDINSSKGEEYLCAKYSELFEHDLETEEVLISSAELHSRVKKEKGMLQGLGYLFNNAQDFLKEIDDQEVLSDLYEDFSRRFSARIEYVTGLNFDTTKDWFIWWGKNKNNLVLSDDGKHIVVKK